ncbi:MAG: fibronectin type III domain-containing protein, partial [Fibrobacter sp.]|nr:fibronectin type III domain-containing protein [Fibrobacter sp.]
MKKINLLFAMLISMLMMFAACSSTSDSLDEEDEDSPADVVKGSSSSKKGNSSSESITPFDSTMDVNTKLASPSDLKAIARSDTSWELQWSYIRNDGFAEEGFYILQLDIEKSQWLEVGKASAEVTHYNIKGADMSGHYYRVCAYNKAGRSAYTGEFYIEAVAAETPDATSFILASPTELTASMQTDTTWTLSWKYSRAENAPESGFKIEQLDMAKSTWNEIGKSGAEVTHFVLVGKSKAGFYYRVCAYDKKGNSRYTEDLFVTKPESEAPVSNKIASPANLSVKMLSDNTWELSWEYEPTADHPEAGFYIDQLVPSKEKGKSSDWKNIGISSKEVYHFLLEGEDFAGHYYRVCAFNKDDGNSSYAKEIYIDIPKAEEVQSASLASPTNLKLSIISEGVWELTWDYSPAKRAPEDGFIIQKLQKGEWTDLGKSNKEVYHYQLGIDDKELYYRVCAYNLVGEGDTKTTERSSYTNEVYFTAPKAEDVQNAVIASPSGLTIKSINPSSWELAWNYTASEGVPEKGFIVEQLDMTK